MQRIVFCEQAQGSTFLSSRCRMQLRPRATTLQSPPWAHPPGSTSSACSWLTSETGWHKSDRCLTETSVRYGGGPLQAPSLPSRLLLHDVMLICHDAFYRNACDLMCSVPAGNPSIKSISILQRILSLQHLAPLKVLQMTWG